MRTTNGTAEGHHLKCWPQYFRLRTAHSRKPFEVRRHDRDFQAGDILHLHEWDPATGQYTGESKRVKVIAVHTNVPGLQEGYCVMTVSEPLR